MIPAWSIYAYQQSKNERYIKTVAKRNAVTARNKAAKALKASLESVKDGPAPT